ncbi:MAG: 50S ribosomal protein L13 [Candidatus Moranbacteria bacterium CG23_combo_of_CG06-09_8_20_14_all_39_10]|nr:MAG: 50S ribosomal protein L13 [Candidatus Moranbacteria bacterium CG23_combo_of_CG06-09_8_20_14_all_39_10]
MTKQTIQRKYHLFDAQGKILGRMATEIALILRGKNKVNFTPNIDAGDFVVVINSDLLKVTGNKMEGKVYNHFSGYLGGMTSIKLKDQIAKDSRKVIGGAVYGMLCKNKLRDRMMTRLLIYADAQHKHKIEITH